MYFSFNFNRKIAMSCGCSVTDAILDALPDKLSPSIFHHMMFEAPRVFDEEITVQASKSTSIFLGLLEQRMFPVDQTQYSQIRLTRSSGIQFYNNADLFRKAHSPDNCEPGCVWDPKTFDAGREIITSELVVSDFEQVVPCYDNLLKKYAFVDFFLTVPTFLREYMEDISSQYIRNELLGRAKKIVLTNESTRGSAVDPRKFPNLLDSGGTNLVLLGDLTPSVMMTLYDEIMCYHPDCEGFEKSNGYKMLGLMIDPIQWKLKQMTDNFFGPYIVNSPSLSSEFFNRFTVRETFSEMFGILPTVDLPRADINAAGEVLYHHRYSDVPVGSGGVKRVGNPAFADAKFGVALVVNNDLGFLWDEQPIPIPTIGDAQFGPQYGTKTLENQKWLYLVNYDYDDNPLGKGGKWISQYKTGYHPGPGAECLYAILYPLTKYENVKQGLPEGECFTAPAACADLFVETGCPCPMVKFCCNITSTSAVLKTDTDIGVVAEDTFEVIYDDGTKQTLTADEVETEDGLFIYRVSSATAIRCSCIADFVCGTEVVCFSQVLSTSDAKQPTEWGIQLDSCFSAPVATDLLLTFGDGTTAVEAVTEISTVNVSGVDITYHYVAVSWEDIVTKGGIVKVALDGVDECADPEVVIECTPAE